jgi:Flp pilus assembly protein CpaB
MVNDMTQPHTPRPVNHLKIWLFVIVLLSGLLGAAGARLRQTFLPFPAPQIIFIPKRTLPIYYIIKESDLKRQLYFSSQPNEEIIKESEGLVGRYTLVELPENQLVNKHQLGPVVEPASLSNMVAIEIPATKSMVMNNQMLPGDVIDIALTPLATVKNKKPVPILFKNILVLNVKPIEVTGNNQNQNREYILVVAMPMDRRLDFVTASNNASIEIRPKSSTESPGK